MAVAGTLLALAVVELALRWSERSPEGPVGIKGLHELRLDRPWLYGLRPNAVGRAPRGASVVYRTNADGFRDRDYERPKPDDVFRIVVLGDSVTFGVGVELEQTFHKILEAELREQAPEAHVEVLGLGVGGYNPYTEAALFEDVGAGYEPDLVVVQFCINDLDDPTAHFSWHSKQLLGKIPDAAYPDPSRRGDTWQPLYLPRSCQALAVCTRLETALQQWLGPRSAVTARRSPDAGRDPRWAWVEEQYASIERAAADQGAGFAVLISPHRVQLAAGGGDVAELVRIAQRRHWVLVDPLPAFRRAQKRGHPPILDWWHPTVVGHRLTARALLGRLACGVLPDSTRHLCASPRGDTGTFAH